MKHLIQCTALSIVLLSLLSSCGDNIFGPHIKGSGQIATEDRQLASFNGIEVEGSANVILSQDDNQLVQIEADDNIIPMVETNVRDEKLYIKTEGQYTSKHDVKIYITLPEITEIAVEGSGDVYGETVIVGNELAMDMTGSGNVDLELDYTYLSSDINGSGRFILYGKVGTQEVNISGSGDYNAHELFSETCSIKISGSGNGKISASKQLDANISGSGDIIYFGNPRITSSVSGSGNLRKG